MAESKSKKSGMWKEVLGWIGAFVVVFLFYAVRNRRTVHNFVTICQENPLKAILILVVAVALAIGITVLRNVLQNRKK